MRVRCPRGATVEAVEVNYRLKAAKLPEHYEPRRLVHLYRRKRCRRSGGYLPV